MIPEFYDYADAWKNIKAPCMVQPHDNATYRYYFRYLFKRACSLFKWELPDHWDLDFYLYVLYSLGFVAVVDTESFGVIPQWGSLTGYDVYYRPVEVLVNNPVFTPKDDKRYGLNGDNPEATLIKLQPDYSGVYDICGTYAARLAYIHEALYMNLINSKLAYVFLTDNKATAETFKKVFDGIQKGEPAAIAGSKLKGEDGKPAWDLFTNSLKQNYIATDLLDNMRTVLNDFDSFIGIPSANTEKRERLIKDEVNANNVETETLIDLMEQTLEESIEHTNSVFGLNISFRRRYNNNTERGIERENNSVLDVSL